MNVLLIAATEAEIAPLATLIAHKQEADGMYRFAWGTLTISITGVGMVATAYALTVQLCRKPYDLVIQAGIGGAFNRQLQIGQVVQVATEQWGDMGAQDHDAYIDIFSLGLMDKDKHPFTNGRLVAPETTISKALQLQAAHGITVNTVSGNAQTIARLQAAYSADVESMEGAAMHYVCLMEGVHFVQLRAISNYVEPRDREKWDIPTAISNLNETLLSLLDAV